MDYVYTSHDLQRAGKSRNGADWQPVHPEEVWRSAGFSNYLNIKSQISFSNSYHQQSASPIVYEVKNSNNGQQ